MRLLKPSLIVMVLALVVVVVSVAYARPSFDLMAGQAVADVAVGQFAPTTNLNAVELAVRGTCDVGGGVVPDAYSFIRWDVSGDTTQTSWLVKVYGVSISPTGGVVGLYKILDDSWIETSLTWDTSATLRDECNDPANLLAMATASGTGDLVFTVSDPFINNQIPPTGDGKVSVCLRLHSCPGQQVPTQYLYYFCDKTPAPNPSFPTFQPSVLCQTQNPAGYPLSVTLVSLRLQAEGSNILVKWTTASEIDNEGFNIYRSEAEDGEYVKINGALIPTQGNPSTGASYSFTDTDVKPGRTYYYKLEDVDTSGVSTFHGPVSATVRGKGR